MLDMALGMLGPDIELLSEIMSELGEKHVRYGVLPEMYPLMGEALIGALEDAFKSPLKSNVKDAWREVYGALSSDMVRVYEANSAKKKSTRRKA